MRLLSAVFVFTLVAIITPATSHAILLTAAKDTYVQSGTSASTNFGLATLDLAKRQDGSIYNRISYFGFDLSTLPNFSLDQATLSLNFVESGLGSTASNISYGFELFGLTNQSLDFWGETSITWNNAPGKTISTNNIVLNPAEVFSLGTFSLTGKGIGAYDFTSQALLDFLNADTNDFATIILTRTTNQPSGSNNYVHAVASRENSAVAGPALNLVPVPEPSTLLLVIAGLVGLGIFGRKKL